ncbi:MAG TPA: hypothetical protein ENN31_01945, partial [Candidatus Vogelbacteria bacterium]|nr:hypothetical protein [Candidatus Vogelbacteria bacterium]
MEELLRFKKDGRLSAQSFIITGNQERDKIEEELLFFLERELIKTDIKNFPDLYQIDSFSFGINESRLLREKQSTKSLSGQGRYFILKIEEISNEAQNALLKVLEEPTENCYFFIISNRVGIFLPTLLSRCQIIKILNKKELTNKEEDIIWAENFLRMTLVERFSLLKEKFGPNNKKNNREDFSQMLNLLEIGLIDKNLEKGKYQKDLEVILKARKYLMSKRITIKTIGEYLS